MNTNTTTDNFADVKPLIRARFAEMVDNQPFVVDYDRDAIWEAYISAFPEEDRQEHTCNACKSFIRQVGGIVTLDSFHKVKTLWDIEGAPQSLRPGLAALDAYVKAQPIAGLFHHDMPSAGVDKNADKVRDVVWHHYHVRVPHQFVNNDSNNLGKESAELRDSKGVLERGCKEITTDAIETVLELIQQGSLYRGETYLRTVKELQTAQRLYNEVPEDVRDNFCWAKALEMGHAAARARGTAIGTLLVDLSEGRDLDTAVKSFEQKVAPTNYKRPTALVTPKMVEAAKTRLQELDLMSALERRRLDTRDLTAADALFVYRPTKANKDVFDQLVEDQPVQQKTLEKVERIGIQEFVENVLPTAKSVRVLVEREHMEKFVTLTGAVDPEAKNLMKWDNSYAWSYTGGVADSIKARVKKEGGKVDGWMRCSLGWHNYDDLDLHFEVVSGANSIREHVYFGSKRGRLAWLDVDMNAGGGTTMEPVENITFDNQLPQGRYKVYVNQYARRMENDQGWELEIEVNGETHHYSSATSPRSGNAEPIFFNVDKDGGVTFENNSLSKSASGVSKWGVKCGQFTRCRAITTSPNHWTKPVDLKHWFFLLEGCISDEITRPFYNEFLIPELAKDRKTTEVLGGKIVVAEAEGAELSGIGFSESTRAHLYVEVEGQFKRTLKVVF